MLHESIIRFLLGGAIVSLFAVFGDILRPRSFAGLFGATPSVALATLALTIAKQGGSFAASEGRSMIVGAIGLCLYSQGVGWLMMRFKMHALSVTVLSIMLWFGVAFGLWFVLLR